MSENKAQAGSRHCLCRGVLVRAGLPHHSLHRQVRVKGVVFSAWLYVGDNPILYRLKPIGGTIGNEIYDSVTFG